MWGIICSETVAGTDPAPDPAPVPSYWFLQILRAGSGAGSVPVPAAAILPTLFEQLPQY